jgi:hypothetical protein
MLELALTHPSYRQNVATFAAVYLAAGALPALISVPFAVRHRHWRSLAWLPTWFAYAFLRRLATLEATISLPVRPFPAGAYSRQALHARGVSTGRTAAAPVAADSGNTPEPI